MLPVCIERNSPLATADWYHFQKYSKIFKKVAMQICCASVDDAKAIAEVHVATWQSAYAGIIPADFLEGLSVEKREAYWREEIPLGKQKIAVAKIDGQMAGWVSYGKSRDEDAQSHTAEIWAIYVSPNYWSSGVGRQLWLHAKTDLLNEGFQSISLWVLEQNARAIDFYRKAGFAPDSLGGKECQIGGAALTEIRYVVQLAPDKIQDS
jgi:ribosomal protein S18 acetylase RimI-like enzyme